MAPHHTNDEHHQRSSVRIQAAWQLGAASSPPHPMQASRGRMDGSDGPPLSEAVGRSLRATTMSDFDRTFCNARGVTRPTRLSASVGATPPCRGVRWSPVFVNTADNPTL